MKCNRYFALTFLSGAIFIGMLAAEPAAERQYVDGTVMAEQIRGKLQAEGFSPITKINVEANDSGEVMLKGVAISDAEASRAVELAKEMQGVMAVKSEIVVKRME